MLILIEHPLIKMVFYNNEKSLQNINIEDTLLTHNKNDID